MNRTAISLLVGLLLLACRSQAQPENTHPVREDLKDLKKTLQRERKLLERLKQKSSSLLTTLSEIDQELGSAQKELKESEEGLLVLAAKLSEYQGQREAATRDLAECRARLRVRLRRLYKMGELGWLNLIFNADSIAGGLKRYGDLRRLAQEDASLIDQTTRWQEVVVVSTRKIKAQQALLRKQKERVEKRKREAELARQQKTEALGLIQKEEALHKRAVLELSKARRRLTKVVSAIEGQRSVSKGFASWRGRLKSPVPGADVEVPFGVREDPRFKTKTKHQGMDLRAPLGSQVKAIYPGKVAFAQPFEGYGLLVILDHGGGYYSLYAHLERFLVAKGDQVAQDQPLGTLGDTGSLKGPFLYFEVRENGRAVDPAKWVRF